MRSEGNMGFKYCVIMAVRERNKDAFRCTLKSLSCQTISPSFVAIVDDGSSFDVRAVATAVLGEIEHVVEKFPEEHTESWIGRPELARVHNYALKLMYENEKKKEFEYLMVLAADTILEKEYVEKVVKAMERNGAIIASGYIIEEGYSKVPRGSGRIFNFKWFKENVGYFPEAYSWESYPLYLAWSRGEKMLVVREAKMSVSRLTRRYKPLYGKAMKELGFSLFFVLGKAVTWALGGDIGDAIGLVRTYLRHPLRDVYGLSKYVREYERERMKGMARRVFLPFVSPLIRF